MTAADQEPFELLDVLGRGGFATTYRARVVDPELREEFGAAIVALKVPLDRQKGRVLRRETELNAGIHMRLKGLQSVNLVRYLGFELFRGEIVMVMEYVEQGSLRNRIGRIGAQRPVAVDEAVRITEEVLEGLVVLHRENVFHRDIKPENILMGRVAKIADFGISRIVDADEIARSQAGTIPYMAPEILMARGASFPADIWSLTVTLYEMLAGRLPFGDERTSLRGLIDLICGSTAAPAGRFSEVPPELDALVARGLQKDPAARFKSAEEMRDALARYRQRSMDAIVREIDEIREMMRQVGGMDAAATRCRELVARYPHDARAFECLGEFHSRRQRYTDAITAFQNAIKLAPGEGLLHWHLALAYQGAGQKRNAVTSLERAMALQLDSSVRRHAAILHKALKGALEL